MAASRQRARFRPDGPEDRFKCRLPEPEPLRAGSKNIVPIETACTVVIHVNGASIYTHGKGFQLFEELGEGLSILVGRLGRVCGLSTERNTFATLYSDPRSISAIMEDRITYVRNEIERRANQLESANTLVERLKTPDPKETIPAVDLTSAQSQLEGRQKELYAAVRKVELLKEVASTGGPSMILSLQGTGVISSTHALIDLRPGEMTFIPLKNGWGKALNERVYQFGSEHSIGPEAVLSIGFRSPG
ncbi:MAG: hypothetical protein AB1295_02330 [Candidatus Micrarchaeota archaeon]